METEYIQRINTLPNDDRVQRILAVRGEPWHDKKTGCTFIRRDHGKCLHCYFYLIDEMLGPYFLSV